MTPEQRLDRVERILGRIATAGRKYRSEFRQNINVLINMHMQNEEHWRAQSDELNEKINILIHAQVETSEQIKGLGVDVAELTKSQKLTDRALRAFIDSLRKGGNGNSST
jgi:hypothetical protein